jgi:hypothetical protein
LPLLSAGYEGTPEDLDTYPVEDRATLVLARTRMAATPHFVHELKNLLAQNGGLSLFVSTDTSQVLVDLRREFGGRVIALEQDGTCTHLDRNVPCLRRALADLLMLAHSR